MFPYGAPPPPPPPPAAQWVPPPPPPVAHDPLEMPADWYIDIPAGSMHDILGKVQEFDRKCGTVTSHVLGGPGVSIWARLRVHGKPLGIHYCVAEIFKLCRGVEAGYSPDVPFPVGGQVIEDPELRSMPVYHAAWVQLCQSKNKN
jgi:hypothetical protein